MGRQSADSWNGNERKCHHHNVWMRCLDYWGTLSFTLGVIILGVLVGCGSGGSSAISSGSTSVSTNSYIRRGGGNGGGYDYAQITSNNLIRRDAGGGTTRRAVSNSGVGSSSGCVSASSSNVSALVEEIGRNCATYCKDQTQVRRILRRAGIYYPWNYSCSEFYIILLD
jgi:hypothetical protein